MTKRAAEIDQLRVPDREHHPLAPRGRGARQDGVGVDWLARVFGDGTTEIAVEEPAGPVVTDADALRVLRSAFDGAKTGQ
jgi:hypothetical protein